MKKLFTFFATLLVASSMMANTKLSDIFDNISGEGTTMNVDFQVGTAFSDRYFVRPYFKDADGSTITIDSYWLDNTTGGLLDPLNRFILTLNSALADGVYSLVIPADCVELDGGNNAETHFKVKVEGGIYSKASGITDINDIYNLNVGDEFTYPGKVTVVFVQGNNMIVTDGTRYLLVYGSTGKTYKAGDIIPAGWGGMYSRYGGVGQCATPIGFQDATTTGTLPEYQVVKTDDALLAGGYKTNNMYLSPVEFKGVTIVASGKNYNVTDEKGTFLCYNQYAVTLPAIEAEKTYKVKGFASCYGTKNEVMIASIEEYTGDTTSTSEEVLFETGVTSALSEPIVIETEGVKMTTVGREFMGTTIDVTYNTYGENEIDWNNGTQLLFKSKHSKLIGLEFEGTNLQYGSANVGTYTNGVWTGELDVNDEVLLTSGDLIKITKIVAKYTADPTEDPIVANDYYVHVVYAEEGETKVLNVNTKYLERIKNVTAEGNNLLLLIYREGTESVHAGDTIAIAEAEIKSVEMKKGFVLLTNGIAKRTGDVDVKWTRLWENGPKFAEYNVGVTDGNPESVGGYYTWGGSIDKDPARAYKSSTVPLSGNDDTATNLWGENWRMPTAAEYDALINNCDAEWTIVNGVNGRKFTGKGDYAENSIFLPAAGWFFDVSVSEFGVRGQYLSSTPDFDDEGFSFFLSFTLDELYLDDGASNMAKSVRAVLVEE